MDSPTPILSFMLCYGMGETTHDRNWQLALDTTIRYAEFRLFTTGSGTHDHFGGRCLIGIVYVCISAFAFVNSLWPVLVGSMSSADIVRH